MVVFFTGQFFLDKKRILWRHGEHIKTSKQQHPSSGTKYCQHLFLDVSSFNIFHRFLSSPSPWGSVRYKTRHVHAQKTPHSETSTSFLPHFGRSEGRPSTLRSTGHPSICPPSTGNFLSGFGAGVDPMVVSAPQVLPKMYDQSTQPQRPNLQRGPLLVINGVTWVAPFWMAENKWVTGVVSPFL